MLTRAEDLPEAMVGAQWPLAGIAAAVLAGLLIAAGATSDWPGDVGETAVISFEAVGDALFTQWAVPFEIASLVLLVALVGAIILARGEEGE
jgi:NADH:ubiquinone oxidoreductase subunit 6 (subunit J)